ncbi:SgcJ/EcaC family oxidoreductase [Mucilaginibacter psychrotolerans]|uniref:SgcJ/EcaC family oxidoreductase n=1 Tax=Mucilaginibacter psychrotolerans TaxID=1524096 RepID=A0A4Y8SQ41_9SPHI|nr:SgcJ/EcaC family oxidoreductase [Mucilaginibacter psychrotolerans]TFF40795.1 SgcJ/EcaC family oxidoreductase [Mucilaginibacter psychrotolerans]
MKRTMVLFGIILSGLTAQAQTKNADVKAIEKKVDALVNSWNKHDHSDMQTFCTADCSWVNIVGMWWKNLKEVEYAIQFYHTNIFKHTTMTNKGVFVRIINPTTALVHLKSYVSEFTTPDGHKMPGRDNIALLVYVKQNGKWLMTAGENVVIDPEAQKNDPILHMNK